MRDRVLDWFDEHSVATTCILFALASAAVFFMVMRS